MNVTATPVQASWTQVHAAAPTAADQVSRTPSTPSAPAVPGVTLELSAPAQMVLSGQLSPTEAAAMFGGDHVKGPSATPDVSQTIDAEPAPEPVVEAAGETGSEDGRYASS